LFEPLVELGDVVKAGQAAGRIHFLDTPWREPSVAYFKHDGIARSEGIRNQREAYFWYPDFPDAGEFLFDLLRDPGQLNNLASTPAGRKRCMALRPVLDTYRMQAG
jgi:hypothetical protein